MRILIDSHTAYWWANDPRQITQEAREKIIDPHNEVFLSSVTAWELGLKASKGKLDLPDDLFENLASEGIKDLSFSQAHAVASIALPPFHKDPFDRALVAQCQVESMTLATRDGYVKKYGIAILEV